MINSKWIIALLIALVCMAVPAMAQPIPFAISGHVYDASGNPCNDAWVQITNLNTSVSWDADNSSTSNYYQLALDSDDVSVDNVLSIEASGCSQSKIVEHTVMQDDIDNGGFSENITLEASAATDLIVTGINSYHNETGCPAWFNLANEIDVTVMNDGTAAAGASNVCLYIDGEFFGKLPVPGLSAGASATVTFTDWMPVGEDCLQAPCVFEWSYKDYNFTGVADCDNNVAESDEGNNETTVVDKTCYNGYMADDPLENVAHGMLHGGVLFTTGDSLYTGLYSVGSSAAAQYDLTLPEGAGVELAHLNVYYTWHYECDTCPQIEVSITNATGTHIVPLNKSYNDHKCTCPGAAWVFPWGNYVYDLTDSIQGSGNYTVTVTRTGGPSVCVAARGIDLVYEDQDSPLIEYWINEGADVLMGGRRYPTSSNLAWWECINNATFPVSTENREFVNATLGVVSPWGGSSWDPGMTNYLFFNDIKLGTGVYHGYSSTYSETIDSMTMHIGGTNAQVGVNVTSVTDIYLEGGDNVAGQCDDGDNMMPCNAFLVVEYMSEVVPVSCELKGVGRRPGHLNSGDNLTLTARVKNTGDSLVYCQMEWQIKNSSGTVVETIPGDIFTEEAGNGPGKTSNLWTVDLDAGSYTVTGLVHYGAIATNLDCTDGPVDGGSFTVV